MQSIFRLIVQQVKNDKEKMMVLPLRVEYLKSSFVILPHSLQVSERVLTQGHMRRMANRFLKPRPAYGVLNTLFETRSFTN